MKVALVFAIWFVAPGVLVWALVAFVQLDVAWLVHVGIGERMGALVAWLVGIVITFPIFGMALEAATD